MVSSSVILNCIRVSMEMSRQNCNQMTAYLNSVTPTVCSQGQVGPIRFDLSSASENVPRNFLSNMLNSFYSVLLLFVLGPLACFPSELIWNNVSYRQLVGLLGRAISLVVRPLPTQENINA
jgi:hypothetical protein